MPYFSYAINLSDQNNTWLDQIIEQNRNSVCSTIFQHCGHTNIGLQTEVVRWIIIIIIGHGGNLYGLIKIVAGSMEQLCYLDMILNEF